MYRNRGIINPISIGAITFLLVSLLLGSVAVVRNNFDIRQRAAIYNVNPPPPPPTSNSCPPSCTNGCTFNGQSYVCNTAPLPPPPATVTCPTYCPNGCITGTTTCSTTQVLPTNPSPSPVVVNPPPPPTTTTSCSNCGSDLACWTNCQQTAPPPPPPTTITPPPPPNSSCGIGCTFNGQACVCPTTTLPPPPPPATTVTGGTTTTTTDPLTGGTVTITNPPPPPAQTSQTTTQEQADAFLYKDYGEDGVTIPPQTETNTNTDTKNTTEDLAKLFLEPKSSPTTTENTFSIEKKEEIPPTTPTNTNSVTNFLSRFFPTNTTSAPTTPTLQTPNEPINKQIATFTSFVNLVIGNITKPTQPTTSPANYGTTPNTPLQNIANQIITAAENTSKAITSLISNQNVPISTQPKTVTTTSNVFDFLRTVIGIPPANNEFSVTIDNLQPELIRIEEQIANSVDPDAMQSLINKQLEIIKKTCVTPEQKKTCDQLLVNIQNNNDLNAVSQLEQKEYLIIRECSSKPSDLATQRCLDDKKDELAKISSQITNLLSQTGCTTTECQAEKRQNISKEVNANTHDFLTLQNDLNQAAWEHQQSITRCNGNLTCLEQISTELAKQQNEIISQHNDITCSDQAFCQEIAGDIRQNVQDISSLQNELSDLYQEQLRLDFSCGTSLACLGQTQDIKNKIANALDSNPLCRSNGSELCKNIQSGLEQKVRLQTLAINADIREQKELAIEAQTIRNEITEYITNKDTACHGIDPQASAACQNQFKKDYDNIVNSSFCKTKPSLCTELLAETENALTQALPAIAQNIQSAWAGQLAERLNIDSSATGMVCFSSQSCVVYNNSYPQGVTVPFDQINQYLAKPLTTTETNKLLQTINFGTGSEIVFRDFSQNRVRIGSDGATELYICVSTCAWVSTDPDKAYETILEYYKEKGRFYNGDEIVDLNNLDPDQQKILDDALYRADSVRDGLGSDQTDILHYYLSIMDTSLTDQQKTQLNHVLSLGYIPNSSEYQEAINANYENLRVEYLMQQNQQIAQNATDLTTQLSTLALDIVLRQRGVEGTAEYIYDLNRVRDLAATDLEMAGYAVLERAIGGTLGQIPLVGGIATSINPFTEFRLQLDRNLSGPSLTTSIINPTLANQITSYNNSQNMDKQTLLAQTAMYYAGKEGTELALDVASKNFIRLFGANAGILLDNQELEDYNAQIVQANILSDINRDASVNDQLAELDQISKLFYAQTLIDSSNIYFRLTSNLMLARSIGTNPLQTAYEEFVKEPALGYIAEIGGTALADEFLHSSFTEDQRSRITERIGMMFSDLAQTHSDSVQLGRAFGSSGDSDLAGNSGFLNNLFSRSNTNQTAPHYTQPSVTLPDLNLPDFTPYAAPQTSFNPDQLQVIPRSQLQPAIPDLTALANQYPTQSYLPTIPSLTGGANTNLPYNYSNPISPLSYALPNPISAASQNFAGTFGTPGLSTTLTPDLFTGFSGGASRPSTSLALPFSTQPLSNIANTQPINVESIVDPLTGIINAAARANQAQDTALQLTQPSVASPLTGQTGGVPLLAAAQYIINQNLANQQAQNTAGQLTQPSVASPLTGQTGGVSPLLSGYNQSQRNLQAQTAVNALFPGSQLSTPLITGSQTLSPLNAGLTYARQQAQQEEIPSQLIGAANSGITNQSIVDASNGISPLQAGTEYQKQRLAAQQLVEALSLQAAANRLGIGGGTGPFSPSTSTPLGLSPDVITSRLTIDPEAILQYDPATGNIIPNYVGAQLGGGGDTTSELTKTMLKAINKHTGFLDRPKFINDSPLIQDSDLANQYLDFLNFLKIPDSGLTIGRNDDSGYQIDDSAISRQHARIIEKSDGALYIENQSSSNQIKITRSGINNGEIKIEPGDKTPRKLQNGDVIGFIKNDKSYKKFYVYPNSQRKLGVSTTPPPTLAQVQPAQPVQNKTQTAPVDAQAPAQPAPVEPQDTAQVGTDQGNDPVIILTDGLIIGNDPNNTGYINDINLDPIHAEIRIFDEPSIKNISSDPKKIITIDRQGEKTPVDRNSYTPLKPGDIINFGLNTQFYVAANENGELFISKTPPETTQPAEQTPSEPEAPEQRPAPEEAAAPTDQTQNAAEGTNQNAGAADGIQSEAETPAESSPAQPATPTTPEAVVETAAENLTLPPADQACPTCVDANAQVAGLLKDLATATETKDTNQIKTILGQLKAIYTAPGTQTDHYAEIAIELAEMAASDTVTPAQQISVLDAIKKAIKKAQTELDTARQALINAQKPATPPQTPESLGAKPLTLNAVLEEISNNNQIEKNNPLFLLNGKQQGSELLMLQNNYLLTKGNFLRYQRPDGTWDSFNYKTPLAIKSGTKISIGAIQQRKFIPNLGQTIFIYTGKDSQSNPTFYYSDNPIEDVGVFDQTAPSNQTLPEDTSEIEALNNYIGQLDNLQDQVTALDTAPDNIFSGIQRIFTDIESFAIDAQKGVIGSINAALAVLKTPIAISVNGNNEFALVTTPDDQVATPIADSTTSQPDQDQLIENTPSNPNTPPTPQKIFEIITDAISYANLPPGVGGIPQVTIELISEILNPEPDAPATKPDTGTPTEQVTQPQPEPEVPTNQETQPADPEAETPSQDVAEPQPEPAEPETPTQPTTDQEAQLTEPQVPAAPESEESQPAPVAEETTSPNFTYSEEPKVIDQETVLQNSIPPLEIRISHPDILLDLETKDLKSLGNDAVRLSQDPIIISLNERDIKKALTSDEITIVEKILNDNLLNTPERDQISTISDKIKAALTAKLTASFTEFQTNLQAKIDAQQALLDALKDKLSTNKIITDPGENFQNNVVLDNQGISKLITDAEDLRVANKTEKDSLRDIPLNRYTEFSGNYSGLKANLEEIRDISGTRTDIDFSNEFNDFDIQSKKYFNSTDKNLAEQIVDFIDFIEANQDSITELNAQISALKEKIETLQTILNASGNTDLLANQDEIKKKLPDIIDQLNELPNQSLTKAAETLAKLKTDLSVAIELLTKDFTDAVETNDRLSQALDPLSESKIDDYAKNVVDGQSDTGTTTTSQAASASQNPKINEAISSINASLNSLGIPVKTAAKHGENIQITHEGNTNTLDPIVRVSNTAEGVVYKNDTNIAKIWHRIGINQLNQLHFLLENRHNSPPLPKVTGILVSPEGNITGYEMEFYDGTTLQQDIKQNALDNNTKAAYIKALIRFQQLFNRPHGDIAWAGHISNGGNAIRTKNGDVYLIDPSGDPGFNANNVDGKNTTNMEEELNAMAMAFDFDQNQIGKFQNEVRDELAPPAQSEPEQAQTKGPLKVIQDTIIAIDEDLREDEACRIGNLLISPVYAAEGAVKGATNGCSYGKTHWGVYFLDQLKYLGKHGGFGTINQLHQERAIQQVIEQGGKNLYAPPHDSWLIQNLFEAIIDARTYNRFTGIPQVLEQAVEIEQLIDKSLYSRLMTPITWISRKIFVPILLNASAKYRQLSFNPTAGISEFPNDQVNNAWQRELTTPNNQNLFTRLFGFIGNRKLQSDEGNFSIEAALTLKERVPMTNENVLTEYANIVSEYLRAQYFILAPQENLMLKTAQKYSSLTIVVQLPYDQDKYRVFTFEYNTQSEKNPNFLKSFAPEEIRRQLASDNPSLTKSMQEISDNNILQENESFNGLVIFDQTKLNALTPINRGNSTLWGLPLRAFSNKLVISPLTQDKDIAGIRLARIFDHTKNMGKTSLASINSLILRLQLVYSGKYNNQETYNLFHPVSSSSNPIRSKETTYIKNIENIESFTPKGSDKKITFKNLVKTIRSRMFVNLVKQNALLQKHMTDKLRNALNQGNDGGTPFDPSTISLISNVDPLTDAYMTDPDFIAEYVTEQEPQNELNKIMYQVSRITPLLLLQETIAELLGLPSYHTMEAINDKSENVAIAPQIIGKNLQKQIYFNAKQRMLASSGGGFVHQLLALSQGYRGLITKLAAILMPDEFKVIHTRLFFSAIADYAGLGGVNLNIENKIFGTAYYDQLLDGIAAGVTLNKINSKLNALIRFDIDDQAFTSSWEKVLRRLPIGGNLIAGLVRRFVPDKTLGQRAQELFSKPNFGITIQEKAYQRAEAYLESLQK